MKIEKNVPTKMTEENIGSKVLYRLPNNAIAKEGTVAEFSPGGEYVRVGKTWVANDGAGILSVLSAPQRRREAIR